MKHANKMAMAAGHTAAGKPPAFIRTTGRTEPMTCTEFQTDLPLIIDSGSSLRHDQHLQYCDVCRDLVNDLRYIADQAKLLVTMMEPNPRVWNGIEEKLKLEGMVKTSDHHRTMHRVAEPYK
jgi:predicted anti-sigma-YlaC factor YlaD